MNWTDYLIIALMVVSCVAGIMRGLLREMISLLTWVLAVVLSWRLADTLAPHLGGALAGAAVRPWAARTLIFLAVLVVGTTVGAVVNHFVRLSIFSGLDRFLGLVFGALRAGVALGLVAIASHAVRVSDEPWYRQSVLMPYAERVGELLRTLGGDAQAALVTAVGTFETRAGVPARRES
jgi:membrane protein required for colicin V production